MSYFWARVLLWSAESDSIVHCEMRQHRRYSSGSQRVHSEGRVRGWIARLHGGHHTGPWLGWLLGELDGCIEGRTVGCLQGRVVGCLEGTVVGKIKLVGDAVGCRVGKGIPVTCKSSRRHTWALPMLSMRSWMKGLLRDSIVAFLASEYSTIYTFLFGTLLKYESPRTLQIVLKETPPSMETCHKQKSSPSKNTYLYRNDMTTDEKLDVSRAIVAVSIVQKTRAHGSFHW